MTSEEQQAGVAGAAPASTEVPAEAMATGERPYYLVIAQYADTAQAGKAYDALRELETGSTLRIAGVVVARRDAKGEVTLEQMTEHSTRNGLGWGVVGGIVVGVLFPPTIIAGAIGTGVLGAAIGKLRNVHQKNEFAAELEDALAPGTSGIVALVDEEAAAEVRRTVAGADRITTRSVDSDLAARIEKEAAGSIQAEAAAATDQDAIRDLSRFGHA